MGGRFGDAAREQGIGRAAETFAVLAARYSRGLPHTVRPSRRTFTFRGEVYRYFHHRHLNTWMGERIVELPIARRAVERASGGRILEVGFTLPQYFPEVDGYTVVDLFEPDPRAINVDVVDYAPGERFDLVLSVSTIEHVGWDDVADAEGRDPGKAPAAIEHLRDLLAPGGTLLVTWGLGWNPPLDAAAREGRLPFDEVHLMKRVGRGTRWTETDWERLGGADRYDRTLHVADAVLIGLAGRRDERPPARP